jgi:hypothetical protein
MAWKKEAGTSADPDLQNKSSSLRDLIGAPPVLQARDAPRYAALEERVYEAFQPKDIIEEIWASDFVALEWEILSLRAVKVHLARSSMRAGLDKILGPHFGWKEREELLNGWVKHDPGARDQVQRHLQALGLDERSIIAQTIVAILRELEIIENQIARAEMRRNLALREFDRHREVVAYGLRSSCQIEPAGLRRLENEEAS